MRRDDGGYPQKPADRGRIGSGGNGRQTRRDPDVALAILRGDESWGPRAVAELGTQAVDKEVDIAVGRVGLGRRDRVEQLAALHQAVRVPGKHEKEGALAARESDLLPVAMREQAGLVQHDIPQHPSADLRHPTLHPNLPQTAARHGMQP
jgi:hypothetical protein